MIGSRRKFLTEFAVNLCSARWLMTTASQITSGGTMGEEEQEVSDRCHIYLICQRPAISYANDSFKYEGGFIEGELQYSIKGSKRKIPFKQNFPLLEGAKELRLSDYPHREVQTIDANGDIVRYLPASALCIGQGMHRENTELGKLEVLYVGQAFAKGKRSALDRLKSHSTLQKILAEAQYNSPDNEVFLLTFEYAPYRIITQMDGRADTAIGDERDSDRFYSILENPLTEHQQICLTEAALIRYFAPEYNEIYKENFPSQKHKILEQCYELDFSGLIVEINTDELEFSLYSKNVKQSTHHICQIDLFNHEDRHGFFHYSNGNNSVWKMPDVITGT